MFTDYYAHHVHSLQHIRDWLDNLTIPSTDPDEPYLEPDSLAYAYVDNALYHLDACMEELDFAARALDTTTR